MKQIIGWLVLLSGIGLFALGEFMTTVLSVLPSLAGMLFGGIGLYLLVDARNQKCE